MRPVFIGGCGRSGTTFLAALLGGHPQVIAPPEAQFVVRGLSAAVGGPASERSARFAQVVRDDWRLRLWGLPDDPGACPRGIDTGRDHVRPRPDVCRRPWQASRHRVGGPFAEQHSVWEDASRSVSRVGDGAPRSRSARGRGQRVAAGLGAGLAPRCRSLVAHPDRAGPRGGGRDAGSRNPCSLRAAHRESGRRAPPSLWRRGPGIRPGDESQRAESVFPGTPGGSTSSWARRPTPAGSRPGGIHLRSGAVAIIEAELGDTLALLGYEPVTPQPAVSRPRGAREAAVSLLRTVGQRFRASRRRRRSLNEILHRGSAS